MVFLIFSAALLAGIMNAVAGGGSFITFPVLVFSGVPSIAANASSTVALFPGSIASAWAYRDDFSGFAGVRLRAMMAASISGGVAGALLLLYTPQRTFDVVIPWLVLVATLAFIFAPRVSDRLQRMFTIRPSVLLASQFLLGVYGGYFGGAVGLMMLALWSLWGKEDLRTMNAKKTLLAGSMNGAAVVCFIIARKVWWFQTLAMLGGAVVGGYAGARVARRANPIFIRGIIIVISIGMTVAFFLRAR